MARFFDEGTLTNDELAAGLARAVADGKSSRSSRPRG